MIWRSIQYDYGQAAWLLFGGVLLALAFLSLYRYRRRCLSAFADQTLLEVLVEKRQPAAFWLKSALCCLAFICGVLALTQPKGNARYVPALPGHKAEQAAFTGVARKKMHEVILLLDASASMGVADGNGGSTRLAVAKEIVDEIISRLSGESVSLLAFTSATSLLVPATTDYFFTRLMLRQIEINEGESAGTDIKQALENVRKRYFEKVSAIPKTLILLSDGGDTHYESLPAQARQQYLTEITKPVAAAVQNHLRIYAVGIGSSQGKVVPGVEFEGSPVLSAVDDTLLRTLSRIGQGQVWLVEKTTPMQVAHAIIDAMAEQTIFEEEPANLPPVEGGANERIYDLYFQLPLAFAIIALALFLLIPDTRRRREGV